MKITALLFTLMAATAVSASTLAVRDLCGGNAGADQRRTNSPCKSGNGDRNFCGCDRTGVVECRGGTWTEIQDCGRSSCRGGNQGGAVC
ncbi:hypothetical protein N7457_003267 [Penicillium paradoxum]|uniref:uncharacterized protein n=1 Tax=Penicillium paradoxum TaxID=176176 RepID=UPI002548C7AD|nr:uncharacterized protein N7457_003267 [Penicillium paradoxum]KAJ5788277.1 hypothetical protein N7457_003267 [Penicillium paradoxum]